MRITNKKLVEQKDKRFTVYAFNENGNREMAYGNLTIIDLTEYLLNVSSRFDTLVTETKEHEVRVITELEKSLRRRATKSEISEFKKTL